MNACLRGIIATAILAALHVTLPAAAEDAKRSLEQVEGDVYQFTNDLAACRSVFQVFTSHLLDEDDCYGPSVSPWCCYCRLLPYDVFAW